MDRVSLPMRIIQIKREEPYKCAGGAYEMFAGRDVTAALARNSLQVDEEEHCEGKDWTEEERRNLSRESLPPLTGGCR